MDVAAVKSEATFFKGNPTIAVPTSYDDMVEYAHIQVFPGLDDGPRNCYVIIIYMENL